MKRKTIYYPPVERVTLPQFARHKNGSAGQISIAGCKHHERKPRTGVSEDVLAEFPASARKLAR